MNGTYQRFKMAHEINFSMRPTDAISLSDIEWSSEVLKVELQRLLINSGLSPIDLVRSWDEGHDNSFTLKEFYSMIKRIVNDLTAWDLQLKHVSKATFTEIAQGNKTIDVIHFERWLNRGWLKEKSKALQKTTTSRIAAADRHTSNAASAAADAVSLISQSAAHVLASGSAASRGRKAMGRMNLRLKNGGTQEEREHNAACILQNHTRAHFFHRQAALVIAHEMTEAKAGEPHPIAAMWVCRAIHDGGLFLLLAALLLQKRYRRVQAQKLVEERRRHLAENRAATQLQSTWRVKSAKRERQRRAETLLVGEGRRVMEPATRPATGRRQSPCYLLAKDQLLIHLESSIDRQPTLVVTTTESSMAVSVVPKLNQYHTYNTSFDQLSHESLPFKLERTSNEPMVCLTNDLQVAVAAMEAIISSHADASQIIEAAAASSCPTIELREANDECTARVLKVLRGFVEETKMNLYFLCDRIDKVQALVEEWRIKRATLDASVANLEEEVASFPVEEEQIERGAQERGEALANALEQLVAMEKIVDNAAVAHQPEFHALEASALDAKKKVQEAENALSSIEARHGAQMEHSSPQCTKLRASLNVLRTQLLEREAEISLKRKQLFEVPRKNVEEHRKKIQHLTKDQQRNLEKERKRKLVLSGNQATCMLQQNDLNSKLLALEKETATALLSAISIDREAVESRLEMRFFKRFRAMCSHGLRYYASGQTLVVRTSASWQDAVVNHVAASGEHVCTLQPGGEKVTLLLHPFNHAARQLYSAEWDEVADGYRSKIIAQHATVVDVITGQRRAAFEIRLRVIDWGAWPQMVPSGSLDEPLGASDLSALIHEANIQRRDTNGCLEHPLTMLVTAPAAGGKSCFLSQVAAQVAKRGELVPIRVRIAHLHARLTDERYRSHFMEAWNWIDALLRIEFGSSSVQYLMLRQAMMARRAVLLVDGLDTAGKTTQKIQKHLEEVIAPQGHVMIITCTSMEGAAQEPWLFCLRGGMMPLSRLQQQEIISSRIPAHNILLRNDLLHWIEEVGSRIHDPNDPSRQELTSNPLMLSVLVSVMEQRQLRDTSEAGHLAATSGAAHSAEVRRPRMTPAELYRMATSMSFSASTTGSNMRWTALLVVEKLCEVVAFEAHGLKHRVVNERLLNIAASILVERSPGVGLSFQRSRKANWSESTLIVEHTKQLVSRGQVPFVTLISVEPFEMMFSHFTFQEYLFTRAAMRGHQFPIRMQPPWLWCHWWTNVLQFGTDLGAEQFGKALYIGCAEDPENLKFNLQARLISYSKDPGVANMPSTQPLTPPHGGSNRTLSLKYLALMIRHCQDLNLGNNSLEETELDILAAGLDPLKLMKLNLSDNYISNVALQNTITSLLIHGAQACTLQSLILRNCGLRFAGPDPISELLAVSQSLTLLDIRCNDLTEDGMRSLGHSLLANEASRLAYLRSDVFDLREESDMLDLWPPAEAGAAITLLSGVLCANHILRQLRISKGRCNDLGASALCSALRLNTTLIRLQIACVSLGDVGVKIISSALGQHPVLQEVYLNECSIGEAGAESLAMGLRDNTTIQVLNVANNRMHEIGVSRIARVSGTMCNLRELNLGGNGAGYIGAGRIVGPAKRPSVDSTVGVARELSQLIATSTSLTMLDLWRIGLRDEDHGVLGEALLNCEQSKLCLLRCDAFDLRLPETTELRLGETSLSSRVIPLLAGITSRNYTLSYLDLRSNGLGDNGAIHLSRCFRSRCTLARLNVASNFIRVEGLVAIASILTDNDRLEALDLRSNQVCGVDPDGKGRHSCRGVKALSASVGTSALTCLNLSNNRLEASGAKALSRVLRAGWQTLREISLLNNNITFFGLNLVGLNELVTEARRSPNMRVLRLSSNHLNMQSMHLIKPPTTSSSSIFESPLQLIGERCRCHHCANTDIEAANVGRQADPEPSPNIKRPSAWRSPLQSASKLLALPSPSTTTGAVLLSPESRTTASSFIKMPLSERRPQSAGAKFCGTTWPQLYDSM